MTPLPLLPSLDLSGVNVLIMLVLAHWIADYPLQTDRMAVEKCAGCDKVLNWRWWLTAHAGTHGFFVGWITGVPLLGLAEWGLHTLIDWGKCNRRYGMAVDQSLHVACKLLWVLLLTCAGDSGLQ
jgi:hypothetical protein